MPSLGCATCTKSATLYDFDPTAVLLVEAAGVEPASENVTGQEPTCVVAFMPWALPQDVRGTRSERTRNALR